MATPMKNAAKATAQPSMSNRCRSANSTCNSGSSPKLWKVIARPSNSGAFSKMIFRLRTPVSLLETPGCAGAFDGLASGVPAAGSGEYAG